MISYCVRTIKRGYRYVSRSRRDFMWGAAASTLAALGGWLAAATVDAMTRGRDAWTRRFKEQREEDEKRLRSLLREIDADRDKR